MRRVAIVLGLLALGGLAGWGLTAPAGAAYDPSDEWQGLPADEGREAVYFGCIACHSTAIIQQQRMTEGYWKLTLDRMVDEMGMPELPADEYDLVLDYLVTHFGADSPR